MVRRATLRVDGYVFVLPEAVNGVAETPFYAKVESLSRTTATVSSLDLDVQLSCDIEIEAARSMVVTKAEATRTRQRRLLRQAVWTESSSRFWHGQVVGIDGRLAKLQLVDRVVLVEPARLNPVAPVVALLLQRVPLLASISRSGLMDMQTTILARILDGSAGAPASNAIPAILDGLVAPADMPTGQATCKWVNPRSGQSSAFRLQHAVDFAFVVDGNQAAPRALRASVGPTFFDDPLYAARNDSRGGEEASAPLPGPDMRALDQNEQAGSIVSLFAQEEPASPVRSLDSHDPRRTRYAQHTSSPREVTYGAAQAFPLPTSGPSSRATGASLVPPTQTSVTTDTRAASLDARIMESLLHQPDLLARFVQMVTRPPPIPASTPSQDIEPIRRTSKYSFSPSAVQVAVHDSITAPEHRGKLPIVFVETVIYAAAVRFQPHPGIIIRLYDFQFGMLGLSILHFAPFGVHQRMSWLNAGGVNMQNFSAGVTAPKPVSASSMGILVDAARMLCRYGQEFFAQPVRDVLEALLDFLQQLDGWHSWLAADLPHLVYWINSVLEQFRSYVHSSNGNIQASSLQTISRFSLNDGELQNVMHALSRRSVQHALPATRSLTQAPRSDRNGQRQNRIPPAIFDLIPTHNGAPVCLRYLSAMGCPSGNSSHCVYGNRAHAAPDTLDARVKGHIIQRMGGLSERFSHL